MVCSSGVCSSAFGRRFIVCWYVRDCMNFLSKGTICYHAKSRELAMIKTIKKLTRKYYLQKKEIFVVFIYSYTAGITYIVVTYKICFNLCVYLCRVNIRLWLNSFAVWHIFVFFSSFLHFYLVFKYGYEVGTLLCMHMVYFYMLQKLLFPIPKVQLKTQN